MNARVRTSSATRSASRSAVSDDAARRTGAPFSPVNDVSGGSHSTSDTSPRGESSPVIASTSSPVSRPAATSGSATVAEASTNVGRRAVQRADPPQPAQHVRDVGAEHAAVVVALVDDDVLQRAEERRPARVPGQQRAVQHVGVGEDVLGVVARPVALLAGAVAVVGRHPDVEPEAAEPGELVLGQRLGRRQVEHRRAALAARAAGGADRRQRGQLVGEALAGGGAGGEHDVLARVGGLGGDRLVPPGPLDPAAPGTPRRRRRPPSPASRPGTAARAGSTSRWRSRSSRPGTAASRSTTSRTLRGRDPRADVTPLIVARRHRHRDPSHVAARRLPVDCRAAFVRWTGRAWFHCAGRMSGSTPRLIRQPNIAGSGRHRWT